MTASTLFNTWQRIAGSFGIGLVAALYATQARGQGPVAALHSAGLLLAAIALAGALGAAALPAVRNTAPNRLPAPPYPRGTSHDPVNKTSSRDARFT